MIFKNLIIISFLGINLIEAADSSQPSTSKNDKRSQKENREASHEIQNQFVNEENSRRTLKAERLGDYRVVYMPKKVAIVPESDYFNKKTNMDESEIFFEKPENKKNVEKKVVKNAYFNNAVDSESDASSVDDNYPRTHPTVTESNAKFRDFVSGRATRLFLHLPHKYGDFDGPAVDDKSDVLAAQVRPSNYYTSHHPEFDGFMTSSNKEEDIHLWRNESIHPQRTYNPNNEVNPLEPHYNEDVETSQREMATGIGRKIGRDNKSKVFENRNSFSSVNDGCVVS